MVQHIGLLWYPYFGLVWALYLGEKMCAGSPKEKSYYTTTLPFYIETSYKNILALLPSVIAKILQEAWCVFCLLCFVFLLWL